MKSRRRRVVVLAAITVALLLLFGVFSRPSVHARIWLALEDWGIVSYETAVRHLEGCWLEAAIIGLRDQQYNECPDPQWIALLEYNAAWRDGPELIRLLDHPNDKVKIAVINVLQKMYLPWRPDVYVGKDMESGGPAYLQDRHKALHRLAKSDTYSAGVRKSASYALQRLAYDGQAFPLLMVMLFDDHREVRLRAIQEISRLGVGPTLRQEMGFRLDVEKDSEVRKRIEEALKEDLLPGASGGLRGGLPVASGDVASGRASGDNHLFMRT